MGDARIGAGIGEGLSGDREAETEILRPQHQAVIPVLAFLLEPAPAGIAAVRQDCPVSQPVPRPARLLGGDEGRAGVHVPTALEQGHVLGQTRIGHVVQDRVRRDPGQAYEGNVRTLRHAAS